MTAAASDLLDAYRGVIPLGPQRCTARSKRSGEQCKRRTAPGATVCSSHGGRAPQVQRAARRRVAEAEAAALAAKLVPERGDVEPIEDPVLLLAQVAAEVDAWRYRLAKLTNIAAPEHVPALLGAYATSTRRLESVLTALAAHDLDDRRVRVTERQTEILAGVIRGALVELGHDLADPEVRRVVTAHLDRAQAIEVRARPGHDMNDPRPIPTT